MELRFMYEIVHLNKKICLFILPQAFPFFEKIFK